MAEIDNKKIVELYKLLEKLNDFFHNESNFTPEKTKAFALDNYKDINEAYYHTLWEILPEGEKKNNF
ncbi:MAG: hypothetical protein AAGC64_10060 [Bacteroidota bacterium]